MSKSKKPSYISALSRILIASGIVILTIFLLFRTDNAVNQTNLEFIRSCGYDAEETPVNISYITIPEPLDLVYSSYNDIISEYGYDLSEYMGSTAVRYSYNLINYNSPTDDTVRINILVSDNKIISADISSLRKNGFILPIAPTKK